MVPAALRRLGTLGLIALWVLVTGGLLLLLALSVQNSVQFSRLQAWILLANVIALRMAPDRRAWISFHAYSLPFLVAAGALAWLLLLG